jgi:hypothetical protein
MKTFPFGNVVIGFYMYIIVMAASIAIGILWASLAFWVKQELLWKTARGEMIQQGAAVPWPWWLKTNRLPAIAGIMGILTTMYALTGPYCYFMSWLGR